MLKLMPGLSRAAGALEWARNDSKSSSLSRHIDRLKGSLELPAMAGPSTVLDPEELPDEPDEEPDEEPAVATRALGGAPRGYDTHDPEGGVKTQKPTVPEGTQ